MPHTIHYRAWGLVQELVWFLQVQLYPREQNADATLLQVVLDTMCACTVKGKG